MPRDPKRVGELLAELFSQGMIPGKQGARDLQATWASVFQGVSRKAWAEKTHVISFRDGTLTVGVTSSSLLFELNSFHKVQLEQSLLDQGTLDGFKRLRFRADRV